MDKSVLKLLRIKNIKHHIASLQEEKLDLEHEFWNTHTNEIFKLDWIKDISFENAPRNAIRSVSKLPLWVELVFEKPRFINRNCFQYDHDSLYINSYLVESLQDFIEKYNIKIVAGETDHERKLKQAGNSYIKV